MVEEAERVIYETLTHCAECHFLMTAALRPVSTTFPGSKTCPIYHLDTKLRPGDALLHSRKHWEGIKCACGLAVLLHFVS